MLVSADITIAEAVTDDLVEAFDRLIPQLSSSSPPPGRAELEEIVTNPNSALFVARVDGAVVGSLTLAFYRIPTGLKAWIEDVVVDGAARGLGIGEALNRAALDEATGMPYLSGITEMALFAQGPPIYGGTDQVQRNIIGERILGLPKEPGFDKGTPFKDLPKNG